MIYKLIEYITNWQKENDFEFKLIPIDGHSAMIFNMGNQEFKFIFSSKYKATECRMSIPSELLEDFVYIIDQEDGLTLYKFK